MALLVMTLLVIASGLIIYKYYQYLFSKRVVGEIVALQRVSPESAVILSGSDAQTHSQLFSYAVAIKRADGEMVTASTEDRQWAVAKIGICAEAKFYPYPPWDLEKAGTYHGARLVRLFDCGSAANEKAMQEVELKDSPSQEAAPWEPSESGDPSQGG